MLTFVGLILWQEFHEMEHLVQVLQRFVFHNPRLRNAVVALSNTPGLRHQSRDRERYPDPSALIEESTASEK